VSIRIMRGDCRDVLGALPDESVHCVVTSPPYWGLRDYGIEQKIWGGDPRCRHVWGAQERGKRKDMLPAGESSSNGRVGVDERQGVGPLSGGCFCGCGAWRGSLGLEPSYQLYVEHMVEVFREVRRVLRSDGTLWLNVGDCYYSQRTHMDGGAPTNTVHRGGSRDGMEGHARPNRAIPQPGLKAKDLVGIPWRVAFALQADGWWLRSEIIWSKPNPMPESITDRPTKAHEYLFLLSKSERYYYDADAIKEDGVEPERERNDRIGGANGHTVRHSPGGMIGATSKRNRRSVWEIATAPFSEAHFATFPPALIEPCILAGCPKGGTVLDPFGGAGTTGLVADRLGRNAILIELNPDYADMAERRIRGDAGMFAEVST
jgi:DNA modification methylase